VRIDRPDRTDRVNRVGNGREYRRDDRYAMADQPTPAMPRGVEAASGTTASSDAARDLSSGTTPSAGLPVVAAVPHTASGITPIPAALERPAPKND
jgi:hypothetical protein